MVLVFSGFWWCLVILIVMFSGCYTFFKAGFMVLSGSDVDF